LYDLSRGTDVPSGNDDITLKGLTKSKRCGMVIVVEFLILLMTVFTTQDHRQILYDALFYKPTQKNFFLRVMARLTGGRVILYQDCWGKVGQTIAYKMNGLPEGTLFAYVYFSTSVGPMSLLPDNSCTMSYITRWRFL
jgi:hypothetical protein